MREAHAAFSGFDESGTPVLSALDAKLVNKAHVRDHKVDGRVAVTPNAHVKRFQKVNGWTFVFIVASERVIALVGFVVCFVGEARTAGDGA